MGGDASSTVCMRHLASHPERREAGAAVDLHGEGGKLVPREDQRLQLRSQVVPGQEEVLEAEVR